MTIITKVRQLAAVLLLSTLAACGGGGTNAVEDAADSGAESDTLTPDMEALALPNGQVRNFVLLQSDRNDPVGKGKSAIYTQADSGLRIYNRDASSVNVDILGYEHWSGFLAGPTEDVRLRIGVYRTSSGAGALLSWARPENNTACGTGFEGWFLIQKATYSPQGILTAVDATFEQRCNGARGVLRGQIHWRNDDATVAAGPVNPSPARLWKPLQTLLPTAGNYFHTASEAGDTIGGGQTKTRTQPPANITVNASGNAISIGVDGDIDAWLYFRTMSSLTRIKPGYYEKIRTVNHENNPATGYLEVGNDPILCSAVNGWVVVDKVTYTGDELTAIELRFEQHCNDATPAIRGAVRWVKA